MITSIEQFFCKDQSVVDGPSTNIIDLGVSGTPMRAPTAIKRDCGPGEPVMISGHVTQTVTGATGIQFNVETSPDASTWTTLASSNLRVALAVVGAQFPMITLPRGAFRRYMQIRWAHSGTPATAGTATVCIALALQSRTGLMP